MIFAPEVLSYKVVLKVVKQFRRYFKVVILNSCLLLPKFNFKRLAGGGTQILVLYMFVIRESQKKRVFLY